MSQVLLAKCNVIRISSFWNMICKNGEKNLLVTQNKKIFSFYNWYQCYLELDLLPLIFQQTPSQFHINTNWFQPLFYNQTPELVLMQLRFQFLSMKKDSPRFICQKNRPDFNQWCKQFMASIWQQMIYRGKREIILKKIILINGHSILII